jgi:hypothetical protein
MRPEFEAAGAPLPVHLAVSCSWPSGNSRTVIGECWVAEASSRGYVEVFISPVLDQVSGLQGVLTTLRHELVHAAGRRGHGKEFKALAAELGLAGPMTATVASPELLDFIKLDAAAAAGPVSARRHHRARRDRGSPHRARRQADHPPAGRSAEEAIHADAQGRVLGVRIHDPADQEVGGPGAPKLPD